MKEYIITFKTSYQIAPDDWAVCNPALRVTEETKIKEIDNFFRKHNKIGTLEVKLIELDNIERSKE